MRKGVKIDIVKSDQDRPEMEEGLLRYVQRLEMEEEQRKDPVKALQLKEQETLARFQSAMVSLRSNAEHFGKIAFSGSLTELLNTIDSALKYESWLSRVYSSSESIDFTTEFDELKAECLVRIRRDIELIEKRIGILTTHVKAQKAESKKASVLSKKISYQWYEDPETELQTLYDLLIGDWIYKETTKENFMKVFTGQPLIEIQPIFWLKGASALLYFLGLLCNDQMKGGIYLSIDDKVGEKKKYNDFDQLIACFTDWSGKEFDKRTLSVLSNQLSINLGVNTRIELDRIIGAFF